MAYSAGPPTEDGSSTQKDMFELGLCDHIQQLAPVHVESEGAVKVYIYDRVEGAL